MITNTTKTTKEREQFSPELLKDSGVTHQKTEPQRSIHTQKDLNMSRFRRWAAVAASVVGISVGMVMPAHAVNRADCEPETFNISQGQKDHATMCFANGGETFVGIADVHQLYSGNNAGFVITNKGTFNFGKHQVIDFIDTVGTVTILQIHIN